MGVGPSRGQFRPAQRLPKDIDCPNPHCGLDVGLNPTLVRLPVVPEYSSYRRCEVWTKPERSGANICSVPQSRTALSRGRGPQS